MNKYRVELYALNPDWTEYGSEDETIQLDDVYIEMEDDDGADAVEVAVNEHPDNDLNSDIDWDLVEAEAYEIDEFPSGLAWDEIETDFGPVRFGHVPWEMNEVDLGCAKPGFFGRDQ